VGERKLWWIALGCVAGIGCLRYHKHKKPPGYGKNTTNVDIDMGRESGRAKARLSGRNGSEGKRTHLVARYQHIGSSSQLWLQLQDSPVHVSSTLSFCVSVFTSRGGGEPTDQQVNRSPDGSRTRPFAGYCCAAHSLCHSLSGRSRRAAEGVGSWQGA